MNGGGQDASTHRTMPGPKPPERRRFTQYPADHNVSPHGNGNSIFMRMGGRLSLALLLAATAAPAGAEAPASPQLEIAGRVAHPQVLTLSDLRHFPATTVELTQTGGHGPQHATWSGVLLWTLLQRAAPVDEPGRKTTLRHTILAHGTDGYAVALAVGEIDPAFEGKQVIVALARDGAPLHSLELVVPGDRHAGRDVHDLDKVSVN